MIRINYGGGAAYPGERPSESGIRPLAANRPVDPHGIIRWPNGRCNPLVADATPTIFRKTSQEVESLLRKIIGATRYSPPARFKNRRLLHLPSLQPIRRANQQHRLSVDHCRGQAAYRGPVVELVQQRPVGRQQADRTVGRRAVLRPAQFADSLVKRMVNCLDCGFCVVECFSCRRFDRETKTLKINGCIACGKCLRLKFCMGWRHRFWRRIIVNDDGNG